MKREPVVQKSGKGWSSSGGSRGEGFAAHGSCVSSRKKADLAEEKREWLRQRGEVQEMGKAGSSKTSSRVLGFYSKDDRKPLRNFAQGSETA